MKSYQNVKIYKIVNDVNDEIYVGSTAYYYLSDRMKYHRVDSLRDKNKGKVLYQKFKEIGIDHFKIILLEKYPCTCFEEQRMREQHYIDLLKPRYNMQNAYTDTTTDEYKEKRNEKVREYYSANKDVIVEKRKEYYENNRDEIVMHVKEWREKNLDHRLEYEKEYREKNAERISDYAKEWREKNKEKIKAKKAEKELCVCGEYYTMPHKNRHMKTKKHQNFISAQNK